MSQGPCAAACAEPAPATSRTTAPVVLADLHSRAAARCIDARNVFCTTVFILSPVVEAIRLLLRVCPDATLSNPGRGFDPSGGGRVTPQDEAVRSANARLQRRHRIR